MKYLAPLSGCQGVLHRPEASLLSSLGYNGPDFQLFCLVASACSSVVLRSFDMPGDRRFMEELQLTIPLVE